MPKPIKLVYFRIPYQKIFFNRKVWNGNTFTRASIGLNGGVNITKQKHFHDFPELDIPYLFVNTSNKWEEQKKDD